MIENDPRSVMQKRRNFPSGDTAGKVDPNPVYLAETSVSTPPQVLRSAS